MGDSVDKFEGLKEESRVAIGGDVDLVFLDDGVM